MSQQRVLILFAHPAQHRSEVNVQLFKASQNLEQVTLVDLYQEYPTFRIDIDREQQRLLDHDVIVFMFPLYWYSTPSILKEWQDLVLEYGFAYGHEGKALHNKTFLCALTAGGAEKAYQADGYNHFTLRELLHPLEQTANLCGMTYVPPFALFGALTAGQEGRVATHIQAWQSCLNALVHNQLDIAKAQDLNSITQHISELTGETL